MATIALEQPLLLRVEQESDAEAALMTLTLSEHYPAEARTPNALSALEQLLNTAVQQIRERLALRDHATLGLAIIASHYARAIYAGCVEQLSLKGFRGIDTQLTARLEPSFLNEEIMKGNELQGPTLTFLAPGDAAASALLWACEILRLEQCDAVAIVEPLYTTQGWAVLALPLFVQSIRAHTSMLAWEITTAGPSGLITGGSLLLDLARRLLARNEETVLIAHLGDVALYLYLTTMKQGHKD
jgi:hypothetical protein